MMEKPLLIIVNGPPGAGKATLAWRLAGGLTPLALGGAIVAIDTTTPDSVDYTDLLRRVRVAL